MNIHEIFATGHITNYFNVAIYVVIVLSEFIIVCGVDELWQLKNTIMKQDILKRSSGVYKAETDKLFYHLVCITIKI